MKKIIPHICENPDCDNSQKMLCKNAAMSLAKGDLVKHVSGTVCSVLEVTEWGLLRISNEKKEEDRFEFFCPRYFTLVRKGTHETNIRGKDKGAGLESINFIRLDKLPLSRN